MSINENKFDFVIEYVIIKISKYVSVRRYLNHSFPGHIEGKLRRFLLVEKIECKTHESGFYKRFTQLDLPDSVFLELSSQYGRKFVKNTSRGKTKKVLFEPFTTRDEDVMSIEDIRNYEVKPEELCFDFETDRSKCMLNRHGLPII